MRNATADCGKSARTLGGNRCGLRSKVFPFRLDLEFPVAWTLESFQIILVRLTQEDARLPTLRIGKSRGMLLIRVLSELNSCSRSIS